MSVNSNMTSSLVKFWQGLDLGITENNENNDKYVVF